MKAIVDLKANTLTLDGGPSCTLAEAGLSKPDKYEILDALIEYHRGFDLKVEFVNGESFSFAASVALDDLEDWNIDPIYQSVAEAKGISFDEAKEWELQNYYAHIMVDAEGKTTWEVRNYPRCGNNHVGQGGTGDDQKTIEDLRILRAAGKLWAIDNFYQP